jgi:hypothetical protein
VSRNYSLPALAFLEKLGDMLLVNEGAKECSLRGISVNYCDPIGFITGV